MVGTFQSTGCESCRKRRKKCGKELPACSLCVKAGWKCPGYARRWKFVDETQQLASTYSRKKYIFEDVEPSDLTDAEHVRSGEIVRPTRRRASNDISIRWSLTSPSHGTCSTFCYILGEPGTQTTFPIRSHGHFYAMVPSRLGHNAALDDAVSCLCSLYIDALRASKPSTDSLRLYAKSLRTLRQCLNVPRVRAEGETICASIILQGCELMMSAREGRWNELCQGSKLLIQECGPERFVAGFERAMLESQRAWYIVQDAKAGRGCFLSQPAWRELLRSSTSIADCDDSSIALRGQLCDFLVDVPQLIDEAMGIAQQTELENDDPTDLTERRASVLLRMTSLRQALECWYLAKVSPRRWILSVPPTSKPRITNKQGAPYEELLFAVVDCASNSILLKLDAVILRMTTRSAGNGLDVSIQQSSLRTRQLAIHESLNYVRQRSLVAAKPLEYGLRQLWLDAG